MDVVAIDELTETASAHEDLVLSPQTSCHQPIITHMLTNLQNTGFSRGM